MEIKWTGDGYPHMNIKENKGVTYLTFPALEKEEGFVHGFSTRLGGVSEGIYASMNLSFTRGIKRRRSGRISEDFPPLWVFRLRISYAPARHIRPM